MVSVIINSFYYCILHTFKISCIDQIIQFHQMIYEKWNFKKLLELENVNYNKQNEESLESKEVPIIR